MPVIETPRLLLRPLPREHAEALVLGHRPPGVNWAVDYPTDATLVAALMVLTAEAEGRPLGPWTAYQVVVSESGTAVGGCGFVLGPPDRRGDVFVASSIVESERAHGYAEEALRALIEFARTQPDVTRVLAETALTNTDGLRVYVAAGMRCAAAEDDLVVFEA